MTHATNAAHIAPQPKFMQFITEQVGLDFARTIVTQFGGATVYIPGVSKAMYQDLREVAMQALNTAFRLEMEEVMRGAVSALPEHHHEWLARAQHSVEQHLSAKCWIEHFSAPASSHTAQSSAE